MASKTPQQQAKPPLPRGLAEPAWSPMIVGDNGWLAEGLMEAPGETSALADVAALDDEFEAIAKAEDPHRLETRDKTDRWINELPGRDPGDLSLVRLAAEYRSDIARFRGGGPLLAPTAFARWP